MKLSFHHSIFFIFVCFTPLLLQAEHMSPQHIQQELDLAEAQFKQAQEMFIPWYTGPLVTPSASLAAPGMLVLQPYLFVTDNHQHYNHNRKSTTLPHSLVQLQGLCVIQFGVTDTVDLTLTPSALGQWQNHRQGGGFQDLPVTLGFLVYKQSLYAPQIKFTIQEKFPTGRYQNLHTNELNLDGLGSGAYQTQWGLAFGKIVNWASLHPISLRLFLGYAVSTSVHVQGCNSYGGSLTTNGVVYPGNTFSCDFGLEVSLTQAWVAALDVVYSASNRTTFRGTPGTNSSGEPASIGAPYSDNLSLAPALEYNFSNSLGLIGGFQISVYGKNSFQFVSGQISLAYTFQ